MMIDVLNDDGCYYKYGRWKWGAQASEFCRKRAAQSLFNVRQRFLMGSGRPSVSLLMYSAAAPATMRPVLLLRVQEYWRKRHR